MSTASGPSSGPLRTLDRLLPILALAAACALLALLSTRRIWSADFWWEWKTGELVSQSGPPEVDVFSYTAAGREWIELRWLYCLGLYRLVRAGGHSAASLATSVLVGLAFLIAAAAGRGWKRPAATAAILTMAGLAASQRFVVRPELATFVLLALYLLFAQRWREGRRGVLWALPPLQVLWANLHPLSALGLVLLALLAIETAWPVGPERRTPERRRAIRQVGLVFAAALAASFATPYGWRGALFPVHLLGQLHGTTFKGGIEEFASPLSAVGFRYLAVRWWLGLCALTAAVVVATLVLRRRLQAFWAMAAALSLYLAATSIRNLPLFALVAIPFLLLHLEALRPSLPPALVQKLPAWRRGLCAATLAVAVFYGWQAATDRLAVLRNDSNQFGLGLAEHRFPIEAVGFLERHGLPGPVFSTMRESSYLIARGIPVFFDPRNDVYGAEHFALYLEMETEPQTFRRTAAEHGFATAVLDIRSGFNNRVAESGEWSLVHFDEVAAVWVRSPPPSVAPLRTAADHARASAAIRTRLPRPAPLRQAGVFSRLESPLPFRAVGQFLLFRGFPELARPYLEDAASTDPFASG